MSRIFNHQWFLALLVLPLSLYQLQLLASLPALSTLLLLWIGFAIVLGRQRQNSVTTQMLINGSFAYRISHIIVCCLSEFGLLPCFLSNFQIFCFICFRHTLCSYHFCGFLLPQILAEVYSSLRCTHQPPFEHIFSQT